jgi:hypothetical protein
MSKARQLVGAGSSAEEGIMAARPLEQSGMLMTHWEPTVMEGDR